MPSIDSGDGRTVLLSVVGLRSEPGVKLPAEAGAKVDYRAQSGGVATMGWSSRAVEDSWWWGGMERRT